MTKFSDFIRAPGTAGPPTQQGIYALGFALRTEIPSLAKYVRVDAAQSFTGGEKTQGQENLGVEVGVDVQAYSAALASIAGLTTAADRLPYTTAANTYAVTTLTAFARTMLDDADAATLRTTIGLGNVDNTSDANKPVSTATQTALNLKANLASPPLTGTPTAPTAALGTNTTQIATTAFVLANSGIELGTPLTATGTARDFAIPAGVKRVTVLLNGVSTSGTSPVVVQLGTGGVPQTTSYAGAVSSGATVTNNSSSFVIHPNIVAATIANGKCTVDNLTSNTWISDSSVAGAGNTTSVGAGAVALAGVLDIVRVTTVNGTDTFDAGTINVTWEY